VWCDRYVTTFRRKKFKDFSCGKLNLSCKFDADSAYGNTEMDLMEMKCDAVIK
jgi:hypothetical protein